MSKLNRNNKLSNALELPGIEIAINICGTEKELALRCGVTQQAVNNWRQKGKVTPKYIPVVAKAVDGKVTCQDLLSDLININ